jgi:hypothetical protein
MSPTGHSQKRTQVVTCYNGLGAARGQRLRKGPCASYPTRLFFGTNYHVNLSLFFAGIPFETNGMELASETVRMD